MHTFKWVAMVAVLLSAAQSPAKPLLDEPPEFSGNELDLFQEIPSVYAASKYEQRLTEAPSSVTIITADEIKKQGYRTIAEVLKSVRSFYVSYDRNYYYLGVRGFGRPGDYNARILILIKAMLTYSDYRYDGSYRFDYAEEGNSPELVSNVDVVSGRWWGTEVQYVSWRKSVSGVRAPPSVTVNIGLFCRNLVEGLEASVHAYNFLDRQNMDPASAEHKQTLIPQDGQTVRLKVSYTF